MNSKKTLVRHLLFAVVAAVLVVDVAWIPVYPFLHAILRLLRRIRPVTTRQGSR